MKRLILGFLLMTFASLTFAQEVANDTVQVVPQKEKIKKDRNINPYFGLTFGLGLGNYTRVAITPLVGIPLTKKLSVGARAGYEYVDYREGYTYNNYGASAFARYRMAPKAYVHMEYAMYNYTWQSDINSGNNWVPFLYLGGGYIQPISKNTALVAEVLFDVLQDEHSPYKNWQPVVSLGVQVGF